MNEERKLAHVELIEWIREIPGADRIVTYGVLGWEIVDQKDKYKVGDKIIYCEVDSILPEEPKYEFLRERKFRIKTIKLKGQISQGLVLPILENLPFINKLYIGQDVTEWLGITKYLSPSEKIEIDREIIQYNKLKKFLMRYSWFRRLFLSRKQKEGFPYWVSKTDEARIQNIPYVLEQFKDKEVYVTEKIDYQSATFTGKMISNTLPIIGKFLPKKFQFVVCSRNLTNNNKNSLYWQIANKYNIEKLLNREKYNSLTIQGEQGAPQVQGNKYKLNTTKFWVFNVINHDTNYHYNYDELTKFCGDNGLKRTPLIKRCKLSELGSTVQELVEFSKGKSVLANIPREGVVIRCIENGQKLLSFKVINPDFLLKFD